MFADLIGPQSDVLLPEPLSPKADSKSGTLPTPLALTHPIPTSPDNLSLSLLPGQTGATVASSASGEDGSSPSACGNSIHSVTAAHLISTSAT